MWKGGWYGEVAGGDGVAGNVVGVSSVMRYSGQTDRRKYGNGDVRKEGNGKEPEKEGSVGGDDSEQEGSTGKVE